MTTTKKAVELAEMVKMIKKEVKKNTGDKEIWEGILNLVKESEFGNKNADIELSLPLPQGRSQYEEMLGNGDGVDFIQIQKICNLVLGGHGSVSIIPFSMGLGTRSMTLKFKPSNTD